MLMPAEAPYEGPSNPPHPYHIYPEKALNIPTVSAVSPDLESSYSALRGPAHPHDLHSQSTPMGDVTQSRY